MIPTYKYDHLTFSEALVYLKAGMCIARPWMEYCLKIHVYEMSDGSIRKSILSYKYSDIAKRTLSKNEIWLKSEDILADDWYLADLRELPYKKDNRKK